VRLGGWRQGTAVAGAIGIVAAVALATVVVIGALSGGDGDQRTIGIGLDDPGETDGTTDDTVSRRPRTTSTTTTPRRLPAPDVLGDVIARDPDTTVPGSVDPTRPVGAAPTSTGTPSPAPAPGPAAGPTPTTAPPAPTTTAPQPACRNSDDPACGPLAWDPAPDAYEVEVVEVSVPLRTSVGREVTFAVDYVERAGADAVGACASWTIDAPGVPNVSTCEAVNHSCARYGPHDPPAALDDRLRVSRTITFDQPGRFEVTVGGHTATHLADGCANPHLASWSRTYVVVVGDADS